MRRTAFREYRRGINGEVVGRYELVRLVTNINLYFNVYIIFINKSITSVMRIKERISGISGGGEDSARIFSTKGGVKVKMALIAGKSHVNNSNSP